ncbi:hypothetical protein L9F63_001140, partial [Diploptera punctata]
KEEKGLEEDQWMDREGWRLSRSATTFGCNSPVLLRSSFPVVSVVENFINDGLTSVFTSNV